MKHWLVGALVVAIAATTVPSISEAKRLGSGKSSGMQRDMPARTAPDAPPAKPATPTNAAPATAATAAAAPAAAAATKKSWLGPIAGIAAGLGIAALLSHFGLGEGLANFLTILLLAVGAFFLIRFLLRRFGPKPAAQGGMQYAGAAAGAGAATPPSVAWPPAGGSGSAAPVDLPRDEPAAAPVAAAPVSRAFVPASFDSEGFARIAKTIFIRLQAANDARNVDDIRRFTTPELFASLQLDLLDRGAAGQTTEVVQLDTEVLDVAEETTQQVVSVRFRGLVREEVGADPVAFDEVWHLVKPHGDGTNWLIAGIEQLEA